MPVVTMTDTQQVVLTAIETDGDGNTVTPSDQLTWTADNTSAVTLTPSADTFSCTVTAAGLGVANVSVSDPGLSLTSQDPAQVTVTAGPATEISISAGTPETAAPAAG
jgi:hypothetical protein